MTRLKKIFYLLAFCFFILNSCKKTEVKGDINYSVSNIFTTSYNYTLSANNYNWDFGDNNFSTLPNPVHRYKYGGLYYVTLKADGQIVKKEIKIETPDTFQINTFTIKQMEFNPTFADINHLYNVYWYTYNERTHESYRSSVIMGVNEADLPLAWNNLNVNISLTNLSDNQHILTGFYKLSDNSYHSYNGWLFTYNYLLGYYGYADTLSPGNGSLPFFEFSVHWKQ